MLRRLGACAIALAVLLPTTATASPAHRTDAAVTKSRTVDLGHKPVRASSRDRVRLSFDGRKGQLVHLARWADAETCGRRVLKKADGAAVKPWATGYWKLPRTGTFTALSKPCRAEEQRVRLQVRKVVQHDAAVPGEVTTIGRRSGVTHLVPVAVGTDERVGLAPSSPVVEVVGPDRRATPGTDPAPVLQERGRHWVALEPRSTLETTLTVRRSAQVDGATIALPRMGTASTTQEVVFTGAADQWVYAELLDPTGAKPTDTHREIRVFGPDGREVEKVVSHCRVGPADRWCDRTGPWLLPLTGEYTMRLSAENPDLEKAATLRVRAAVVAPDLAVDGPAITYRATSPGQWVVGRYPATPMQWQPTDSPYVQNPLGTQVWVQARNASATLGAWTYTMAPRFPWSLNCDPRKDGIGCDEYASVQIGPDSPPTMTWPDPDQPEARDSWALLVVPANAQGSVDITLTKSASQP
jgi:hypothetical protein